MIIKSIDNSGRLVVPVDLLRSAGIERGNSVELYSVQYQGGPGILIKKYQDTCTLCGEVLESKSFQRIRGKKFCFTCIKFLKKEINKSE